MRIAVIADIHGNLVALDTVLADIAREAVDQVVCLGDAIQGGPQPAQCAARLRELGCPVVMGNADDWVLTADHSDAETISEQQREVRVWTHSQLSPDDLTFIAGFQSTVTIALSEHNELLCFHGSPGSYDDVILPETPDKEVRELMGEATAAVLTGGHTHLQQIRRLGDAFFFNPGSVGLGYDRRQTRKLFQFDPWAEYAILSDEGGRTSLEFRKIPVDSKLVVEATLASGRPYAAEAASQHGS